MEQSHDPMKQQAGGSLMSEMPRADHEGQATADIHTPQEALHQQDKPVGELAKDLGKSAVTLGAKIYHLAEEKFQEIKSAEHTMEPAQKKKVIAGAGAGSVALATTAKAIAKRRAKPTRPMSVPKMSAPHTLIMKAKEAATHRR